MAQAAQTFYLITSPISSRSHFFTVIDVPDKAFLMNLQNNKRLEEVLADTKATGIDLIIHFTPEKVSKRLGYQLFIESIGAKRHLVVNDSNK